MFVRWGDALAKSLVRAVQGRMLVLVEKAYAALVHAGARFERGQLVERIQEAA